MSKFNLNISRPSNDHLYALGVAIIMYAIIAPKQRS